MTLTDSTVFLVDDDAAVRDSLSLLLGLKGFRIQSFASAEDFLATYRPEWSGCLVLDLRMPGMDGLELQRRFAERDIAIPVIMITAHGDVAAARAALKGGAVDFLEKPVNDELLVATIEQSLQRDARQRRESADPTELSGRLARLTARERQVLELIAEGLHNREVAARLGISPRTVEVYKARLMEKVQAHKLSDLIRLALSAQQAGINLK